MKSRRRIAFLKAWDHANNDRLQQGFRAGGMGPTVILHGNNPQDRMSALGQKRTLQWSAPLLVDRFRRRF